MLNRRARTSTFFASLALLGASSLGFTALTTAPADAAVPRGHNAQAYGSRLLVGGVVTSGPSANVVLGCTRSSFAFAANDVAGAGFIGVGAIGAVQDIVSTEPGATNASSTIANVSLPGVIEATSVAVTARATAGPPLGASGSAQFANLVVGGTPVPTENPAPNTKIDLPGIGSVTLNEQVRTNLPNGVRSTVRGLHLRVNVDNPLGLVGGADLVIGYARAEVLNPTTGLLGGYGYGTKMSLAGSVTSGRTAFQPMPCLGTGGVTRENPTAGVTLPMGAATTGTIVSGVNGSIAGNVADGVVTNEIEDANVLAGVVSADVVKAQAHARRVGTTRTFDDTGSTFTGLNVVGMPLLPDSVPANTEIAIPGVGTLYLHRVITTPTSIEVRMIELVITSPDATLPLGTSVQVGVARAVVR